MTGGEPADSDQEDLDAMAERKGRLLSGWVTVGTWQFRLGDVAAIHQRSPGAILAGEEDDTLWVVLSGGFVIKMGRADRDAFIPLWEAYLRSTDVSR
jgi:hypothetical protein